MIFFIILLILLIIIMHIGVLLLKELNDKKSYKILKKRFMKDFYEKKRRVRPDRCIKNGCYKFAKYNRKGTKKGLYCPGHRLEGMTYVKGRICQDPECDIQSSFNVKGEKGGVYCEAHKTDDMINAIVRWCDTEECYLRAVYSYDQYSSKHCYKHKQRGMKVYRKRK